MQDHESMWLARAQRGDPEAFTYLVDTYQTPVYNLCYRMLNNPGDAEDAAQETFLRAYKNIKRYDSGRPFPTWLLSIAAHYCIDQIRKRRMAIVSMEDLPYLEISDDGPGPESTVSQREQSHRVKAMLEGLNPVDRSAVVLYYWYDFSYDEISETLDLTPSAIKSRLHRARRSMADAWTAEQAAQAQTGERNRHGEAQSPAF